MRWWLAVGMLAATMGTARADDALPPGKPWALGQWVRYERHVPGERTSIVSISAGAVDGCGLWIERDEEFDLGHRKRVEHTLACVSVESAPPATVAEARTRVRATLVWQDDERPHAGDAFVANQIGDLLMPRASFEGKLGVTIATDDANTVAGHFRDASHITMPDGEAWISAAVPFSGVVLLRDGSLDNGLVLLAYGDSGAPSVIALLAHARRGARGPTMTAADPEPRWFAELGLGGGDLRGHGAEDSARGTSFDLRVGARVTQTLDVVGLVGELRGVAYSPDATLSQQAFVGDVALHWSPFRAPPSAPWRDRFNTLRTFYLQPEIGYAELDRTSYTASSVAGRGATLGLAIGFFGYRARDWGYGFEVSDRVLVLDRGEATRQDLSVDVVFRLYVPWLVFRQ